MFVAVVCWGTPCTGEKESNQEQGATNTNGSGFSADQELALQSSPGHGSILHILDLKDESQAERNHSIPWPWPAGNQQIELRIRRFVTINSNQAGHTRTNQSSNGRERRKKQERLICSYKYFKQAQGQESLPLLYDRTKIWPNKSIQQFNP